MITTFEASGLSYEGFVDDYKSVLSKHRMNTMTTYGIPKSRNCTDYDIEGNDDKRSSKENDDGARLIMYSVSILARALSFKVSCFEETNKSALDKDRG